MNYWCPCNVRFSIVAVPVVSGSTLLLSLRGVSKNKMLKVFHGDIFKNSCEKINYMPVHFLIFFVFIACFYL